MSETDYHEFKWKRQDGVITGTRCADCGNEYADPIHISKEMRAIIEGNRLRTNQEAALLAGNPKLTRSEARIRLHQHILDKHTTTFGYVRTVTEADGMDAMIDWFVRIMGEIGALSDVAISRASQDAINALDLSQLKRAEEAGEG